MLRVQLDGAAVLTLGLRPGPVVDGGHAPQRGKGTRQGGGDVDRPLGRGLRSRHDVVRREHPIQASVVCGFGQAGVSLRVARIPLDGRLEAGDALVQRRFRPLVPVVAALQIRGVGVEVAGRWRFRERRKPGGAGFDPDAQRASTAAFAISSCTANTSSRSRSNRSDQRWMPSAALISREITRSRSPAARTLPSSTVSTFSIVPIRRTSSSVVLNRNAELSETTRKPARRSAR